ncbi:serine protease HTR4-like [Styela clava]
MKWIAILFLFASLISYSKAISPICFCPENCPPVECPNGEAPVINPACRCCLVCPAQQGEFCGADCGLPCATNLKCELFPSGIYIPLGLDCGTCQPE